MSRMEQQWTSCRRCWRLWCSFCSSASCILRCSLSWLNWCCSCCSDDCDWDSCISRLCFSSEIWGRSDQTINMSTPDGANVSAETFDLPHTASAHNGRLQLCFDIKASKYGQLSQRRPLLHGLMDALASLLGSAGKKGGVTRS